MSSSSSMELSMEIIVEFILHLLVGMRSWRFVVCTFVGCGAFYLLYVLLPHSKLPFMLSVPLIFGGGIVGFLWEIARKDK